MKGGKDQKRLERLAKSLLLDKEIPPDVMEKVKELLQNRSLDPEFRNREIIDIVQQLPNKKIIHGDEIELRENRRDRQPKKDIVKKTRDAKPLLGPTETSLFIDAIHIKFKPSKLFKKRLLVHKNNRLGIGLRKRLVPTKRCKQIVDKLADLHERVIYRLSEILDDILFDQESHDPLVYNYLRVFYSWMTNVPLLRVPYDKIVWMERKDFDREFKSYITHFFSFYKLGTDDREKIIFEIERRLREHGSADNPPVSPEGKGSARVDLAKEKEITRILAAVRFFLPNSLEETGPASNDLFGKGEIKNMPDFLFALVESLVFQRSYSVEELIEYYRIVPPQIKHDEWDCSQELLEKAGKNKRQMLEKELMLLKEKLAPYETQLFLLSIKDRGELILHRTMREYWGIIHNKDWQPKQVLDSHFILFVYSVCSYFIDAYAPLINGVPVLYRDYGREEMEGAIFSTSYFESEIGTIVKVNRSFKAMYSSKPIPRVDRESLKKSMREPDGQDDPSALMIIEAGSAFFRIGREMQRILDNHRLWKFSGSGAKAPGDKRAFLDRFDDTPEDQRVERCIPFYDCQLVSIPGGGSLARDLYGKRIVEDSTAEGLFINAAALSMQAAHAFMNDDLEHDLLERNELSRQIDALAARIK